MQTTETTTLRIFTHSDVPNAHETVAQVAAAASQRGLGALLIDAGADPRRAIDAGIVMMPAVVIESDGVETARRVCMKRGRALRRWLDRQLGELGPDTHGCKTGGLERSS